MLFFFYRKTTFYRDRGLRAKVPTPMCVSNVTRILHSLSASEIHRNAIFPIGEVRFLASRQKSCTFATYEWRVRRTYGAIAGNDVCVCVCMCVCTPPTSTVQHQSCWDIVRLTFRNDSFFWGRVGFGCPLLTRQYEMCSFLVSRTKIKCHCWTEKAESSSLFFSLVEAKEE